jgi:tRNA threonylcarbamoyladenosine biosynthesis protein TsaB
MKILALDTSSRAGSAALLDDDRLVAAHQLDVSATHSERLLPAVDRLLGDAGWKIADLALLACAKGPGSFTGLRIGIASAKGMAVAASLPLVGVDSLEATALALAFAAAPIAALIDARKRQVYAALFQPDGRGGLRRLRDDVSTPAAPWAAEIAGPCLFVGDGAELYWDEIRAAKPDAALAPLTLCCPRAASVGWLGRRAFLAGEKGLIAHYVRPSDAELNPKFAPGVEAATK